MHGILTPYPSHSSVPCIIDSSTFYGKRWGCFFFLSINPYRWIGQGFEFFVTKLLVWAFFSETPLSSIKLFLIYILLLSQFFYLSHRHNILQWVEARGELSTFAGKWTIRWWWSCHGIRCLYKLHTILPECDLCVFSCRSVFFLIFYYTEYFL